jgi:predicted PurR-regulated permease PerM
MVDLVAGPSAQRPAEWRIAMSGGKRDDEEAAASQPEEPAPDVSHLLAGEGSGRHAQDAVDDIHAAARIEAGASAEHGFGQAGAPFDRGSPFFIGLVGALGVLVAIALAWFVVELGQVLVLLGLAMFIAVGLDPAVHWLHHRRLPRWIAVCVVLLGAVGLFIGFIALAVPVLVTQANHLAHEIPHYLRSLNNHNTTLGKLNKRYHIVTRLQQLIDKGGTSTLAHGVLGVGKAVFDVVAAAIIVIIISVYLLADLPRVKRGLYRLAPNSRRPRMVLLTDAIMSRVGGYVLGNLLTSFIAGLATWAWATVFGIPYALLLGLLVALLDLIPVVGSTIGGVIVALIALTVSPAIAIATFAFYLVYRFLEDYLLTPRIMARTVDVPGVLTVIATVIGATLLGIIGALIAIPVAAAIKLLIEELAIPTLDRT